MQCSHIKAEKYIASNKNDSEATLLEKQIVESPSVKGRKMSKTHSNSWLSSQYVNGIYIPSGLLLVGIAIVKVDWTPYAALVALILGSWKIYQNRNCTHSHESHWLDAT
jgi:hypothetical protein